MSFVVKKFISQFLMPIPLVFEFLFLGWLLARFSRYKRTGSCLKGFAMLLFISFSYGMGAEKYLYALERRYPPIDLSAADFASLGGGTIIVLGQGLPEKSDLPLRYQTTASFQQRLQEGARLYRKIPDAKMIISLAGNVDLSLKERLIDQYAMEHDLKRADIQLITSANDMSDEARLAMKLVMTNRLVIVTSAAHLPRAVKIFSKELVRRRLQYDVMTVGMLPVLSSEQRSVHVLIPAPCDYWYVEQSVPMKFRLWELPLPSAEGIRRTQHALYEWLGNLKEDLID